MLLLEIQALVDASQLAHPRRVAVGSDANRLGMLLAALHRHAGIATQDQDVFVNVVGGMRITETGADLPLLVAEAAKHGFRRAIVPSANKPRRAIKGIDVTVVTHLGDALAALR